MPENKIHDAPSEKKHYKKHYHVVEQLPSSEVVNIYFHNVTKSGAGGCFKGLTISNIAGYYSGSTLVSASSVGVTYDSPKGINDTSYKVFCNSDSISYTINFSTYYSTPSMGSTRVSSAALYQLASDNISYGGNQEQYVSSGAIDSFSTNFYNRFNFLIQWGI